jgi:hypothetical protein
MSGHYDRSCQGLFEVREMDTKHVYNVATAEELAWLTCYLRPRV